MMAHLSSEQFSRWIAGDRNPDAEQHLQECAQCAAEIVRMQTLLEEFRFSVIAWSELQKDAEASERWTPPQYRKSKSSVLIWKFAAATLVIALAVVLIFKNYNDRRREIEAFQADVKLWEEVNTQVSRPIPAPLEPLMNLIAWEPDAVE